MRLRLFVATLVAVSSCSATHGTTSATSPTTEQAAHETSGSAAASESKTTESESAPPEHQSSLTGTLVLDGSVNGCGGEQIAIQVRDDTGVVGSQFVDSSLEGFDCVFHIDVRVPPLKCYELLVNQQPVGRYSRAVLGRDGYIGIISSESAFGDPASRRPPPLYVDYNGC